MPEKVSRNRRRRLKNETQGRAAPATPKNDTPLLTRLQEAKRQTSDGQLRVFAGETHEQALTRKNAGNQGVRPEQVSIRQGGQVGQSTAGITQGARSQRGTRGGLAIN